MAQKERFPCFLNVEDKAAIDKAANDKKLPRSQYITLAALRLPQLEAILQDLLWCEGIPLEKREKGLEVLMSNQKNKS